MCHTNSCTPHCGSSYRSVDVAPEQFDETVTALRRHVFTPEAGPLVRATLLNLGAESHVLMLLVHHIVSDHASLSIVFDDLVTAYRARVEGRVPHWPVFPVQFADYALWQRSAFDTEWGQAELAYWREALAGLPDEISVASDHARPPCSGNEAR